MLTKSTHIIASPEDATNATYYIYYMVKPLRHVVMDDVWLLLEHSADV